MDTGDLKDVASFGKPMVEVVNNFNFRGVIVKDALLRPQMLQSQKRLPQLAYVVLLAKLRV